jgi:hypothetical protein
VQSSAIRFGVVHLGSRNMEFEGRPAARCASSLASAETISLAVAATSAGHKKGVKGTKAHRRRNRHRHGRTAARRWGLCTRVQCSSRTHGGHRPRDGKAVRPVGNLVSSKLSNRPRRSLRRTYPCGARILKCAKPAELPGGRGVKGSRSNSGSIVTIVPPETETFRNGAR